MSKDDPYISWGQRQELYRKTKDPHWLEHEEITKEAAGKEFARLRKLERKEKPVAGKTGAKEMGKLLLVSTIIVGGLALLIKTFGVKS